MSSNFAYVRTEMLPEKEPPASTTGAPHDAPYQRSAPTEPEPYRPDKPFSRGTRRPGSSPFLSGTRRR